LYRILALFKFVIILVFTRFMTFYLINPIIM